LFSKGFFHRTKGIKTKNKTTQTKGKFYFEETSARSSEIFLGRDFSDSRAHPGHSRCFSNTF